MPRANTWANSDGLNVGFGRHTIDNNVPAAAAGRGPLKVAEFEILATSLEPIATLTATSLSQNGLALQRGSRIKRATLVVNQVFTSGGAATLTIGTVKWDAVGTVDDLDGIDATIALTALDAIGEVVVCDGALVGESGGTYPGLAGVSVVGATSDSHVRIVVGYTTAVYTAGKAVLTVEYYEPQYTAVNA